MPLFYGYQWSERAFIVARGYVALDLNLNYISSGKKGTPSMITPTGQRSQPTVFAPVGLVFEGSDSDPKP